jgi:hypothetical protein
MRNVKSENKRNKYGKSRERFMKYNEPLAVTIIFLCLVFALMSCSLFILLSLFRKFFRVVHWEISFCTEHGGGNFRVSINEVVTDGIEGRRSYFREDSRAR